MEDVALSTKKEVQCLKWDLKGHPSRNLEDSAESNVDYGCPAQADSEENKGGDWAREHSFDILVKNVDAFATYPKNLLRIH